MAPPIPVIVPTNLAMPPAVPRFDFSSLHNRAGMGGCNPTIGSNAIQCWGDVIPTIGSNAIQC